MLNGRNDRGELHSFYLPVTRKPRNVFKLRFTGLHCVLSTAECGVHYVKLLKQANLKSLRFFSRKAGYGNIYFKDVVNIKCYYSHYTFVTAFANLFFMALDALNL